MKRNVFGKINDSDGAAQRIADHFDAPESERSRVFEMTERKLEAMKRNDGTSFDNDERLDVISVERAAPWRVVFRAAAACAAVLVVCAAGFFAARPNIDNAPAEDIILSPDDPAAADETPSKAEDEQPIVSEKIVSSDNSVPEKNVSSAAERTPDSEASAKSSSQSEDKTTSSSPAAQVDPTESRSIEGCFIAGEIETPLQTDSTESDVQKDDDESENPLEAGFITSQKVLGISGDMTYEEVIALLGEPEDCMMQDGYAQYIVDGDLLLMLKWDYKTDPVLRSGKELLESCPRLSDMKNDPENLTFDCYIVDYNGTAIRVTCPQYDLFDCASINIQNGDNAEAWREIIDVAMANDTPLRITHEDYILEVYPPIITAANIEGFK